MFRLGKRAASKPRAPHLSRYLGAARAVVPESYDRSKIVLDWGADGNNEIGDCTCAAAAHAIDLWTAAAGKPRLVSRAETLALYQRFGWNPADVQPDGSNPTDQGCDPQDVLQSWATEGFTAGGEADVLDGFASISPTDRGEIERATYQLGGAYLGIELPAAIEPAFADATIQWDLPGGQSLSGPWAPGSLGGHAIWGVGYDSTGIIFISWGARYRMSWRFWFAYGSEAYALLDRDFADAAIPAEAWAALEADMAALRAAA